MSRTINGAGETIKTDEKTLELKQLAAQGLDALRQAGADQASCRLTRSLKREFNIDGGEFSLYRSLFDQEASLMSIQNGRRGVLKTNRINAAALAEAARDCLAAGSASEPDEAWQLAPTLDEQYFEGGAADCDEELLFERCAELLTQVKADFPLIVVEQMVVSHLAYDSAAVFSKGSCFCRRGGFYELFMMYSAHDGAKVSSFCYSDIRFDELTQPFIALGSMRDDLQKVSSQIETEELEENFTGTLLLTPATLKDFLLFAADNFVSDRVVLDKTSVWLNRLGEEVADPRLNVKLAPHDPRIVEGERHTGEGYLSEDGYLIENGVLKRFLLSDYVARKTGHDRAPNSSDNFVVEGGEQPLAELLGGIKKGVWLGRFSGGQPSTNGDFSGVAKNSFLIENGEIKAALRETLVNGNLADLLKNLRGISAETVADGTSVLPYIAFDGVSVSGKA